MRFSKSNLNLFSFLNVMMTHGKYLMKTDDIRSHDSVIIPSFYTIMLTTCSVSEKGTEVGRHVVIFVFLTKSLTVP